MTAVLVSVNRKDTKQLWVLLKQTGNWSAKKQTLTNFDTHQINDYFHSIATDPNYNHYQVIQAAHPFSHVDYTDSIELILAETIKTTPGNYNIPY